MARTKFNFIRLITVFYIRQQLEKCSISVMGTERLTSAKVSSSLQNKGEDKATMLLINCFKGISNCF